MSGSPASPSRRATMAELPMAQRRALFEQQQAEAAASSGITRRKSSAEHEPEERKESAPGPPTEQNLTLKQRMAMFGVPTEPVPAGQHRQMPPPPKASSNPPGPEADPSRLKPTSPTSPDQPDSELKYKMNMFSAQKNAPQPPDPPPLSRVNSVGPTTANSPRDAPPGTPETEPEDEDGDDSRAAFGVAAKNAGGRSVSPEFVGAGPGLDALSPPDGKAKGGGGAKREEKEAEAVKSTSLKDRMASFNQPSAEQRSSEGAKPTPQAIPAPSRTIAEKRAAFGGGGAEAAAEQPSRPAAEQTKAPSSLANRMAAFSGGGGGGASAGASSDSLPSTSVVEAAATASDAKPGNLAGRLAAFSKPADAEPPKQDHPSGETRPSSLAERKAAFSGGTASGASSTTTSPPDPKPEAGAGQEQPKPTSLADRMAAFKGGEKEKGSEAAHPLPAAPKPAAGQQEAAPKTGLADRMAAFSGSGTKPAGGGSAASSPPNARPEAAAPEAAAKPSGVAGRWGGGGGGGGGGGEGALPAEEHKPLPQPPGKTGSLADRMAAFSGSGGGGGGGQKEKEKEDGSSKQGGGGAEPVVTAKPSAEPPATQQRTGTLADRMAAFSSQPGPAPSKPAGQGTGGKMMAATASVGATGGLVGAAKLETEQPLPEVAGGSGGGGEAGMSLKERMAALQQGSHSKSDDKLNTNQKTGPPPVSFQKRGSMPMVNASTFPPPPTKDPPPSSGAGLSSSANTSPAKMQQQIQQHETKSNTDASALSFWKNQQKDSSKAAAPTSPPSAASTGKETVSLKPAGSRDSPPSKSSGGAAHADASKDPETPLPPPTFSKEEADRKAEKVASSWLPPKPSSSSSSSSSAAAFAGGKSNINTRNLSHQAREVMSALGQHGAEAEAEEAEAERAANEEEDLGVKNRASMFEQSLKGGYERDAAKAVVEPGRIWGAPKKEKVVESDPMDMNDTKRKWQTGEVKRAESKSGAASEDALFRCHVAASTRTGGVAELQNRFLTGDFSEKHPEPKKSSKIAEIAETIHFDPNTMMPGAQHPNLNYSIQENAREKASDWRDFNGGPRKNWDEDDEELPPPPTMR